MFAFGQILGLSVDQTLACFGEHYQAVRKDPDGQAHPNIRLFLRHGWAGICFEDEPLRFRLSRSAA
ncbi:MAG: HopJ type III effector protein [Gammaproteobacteria bacterium]|nr:HopJ type III effector protein [Gammaproteobacteria bacterium]